MTTRMRTDEVWNDLLVETLFLVDLVKDALELVEQIERWLAHELQDLRTGMLRRYLQSAAHMLGNQLAGVFPCRRAPICRCCRCSRNWSGCEPHCLLFFRFMILFILASF